VVDEQYRWIAELRDRYRRHLRRYERQAAHLYPGYWDGLRDAHLRRRGQVPDWCWVPIEDAMAIVEQHAADSLTTPFHHASSLTALAAWRAGGRRIFYLHESCIPGAPEAPPVDALKRMPEWCCYLAIPAGEEQHGFFAHMEWDPREQRAELRLLLDLDPRGHFDTLLAQPIHLTGRTLRDALSATWSTSLTRAHHLTPTLPPPPPIGRGTQFDTMVDQQLAHLGPLVASVAFLGEADAQFTDAAHLIEEPGAIYRPRSGGPDDEVSLWLVNRLGQGDEGAASRGRT